MFRKKMNLHLSLSLSLPPSPWSLCYTHTRPWRKKSIPLYLVVIRQAAAWTCWTRSSSSTTWMSSPSSSTGTSTYLESLIVLDFKRSKKLLPPLTLFKPPCGVLKRLTGSNAGGSRILESALKILEGARDPLNCHLCSVGTMDTSYTHPCKGKP